MQESTFKWIDARNQAMPPLFGIVLIKGISELELKEEHVCAQCEGAVRVEFIELVSDIVQEKEFDLGNVLVLNVENKCRNKDHQRNHRLELKDIVRSFTWKSSDIRYWSMIQEANDAERNG